MKTSAPYVTGKKGRYEIQISIEHPAGCDCEKCAARPIDDRKLPHTYRLRRRSPFPDNKTESSKYAVDLRTKEEQRLQALLQQRLARRVMMLPDVAELYFVENPRMVSAATIERDKISARNLCRLVPRDVRPDAIDQPIAVRYRNARLKEGARPRTVLNELSFLRGLLQFALAWETVTGMRGIRFLKVPAVGEWTSDGVALSRAEFARVLPVLSPINRRRMIFGICTMLRRTPLMGLKAPWVHHDRGWLSVPAEVMKKGRASYRSPLEVPVAEWALEQVADLEANEHGYVWPSGQTGQPLTRVHDFFADCVERSGVRHSLATTSVRPARRGSAKLGWMSSSSQCCSAIAPPLIRRQRPFMSRAPT